MFIMVTGVSSMEKIEKVERMGMQGAHVGHGFLETVNYASVGFPLGYRFLFCGCHSDTAVDPACFLMCQHSKSTFLSLVTSSWET